MSEIEITRINESLNDELADHLHPHLFCSARWIDVLNRQYHFDFFKIQMEGHDAFLIVALIQKFGIAKIKALPFCDYIIPSVENAQTLNKLIKGLQNYFPDLPIELKMVLPHNINPTDLSHQSLKRTAYRHTVDTSIGMDDIENNMDNSFMRGVRKARSNNLHVSIARGKKALANFYEIYCKQRINKFEKLPQPFSFLDKIRENFLRPKNGFILQAEKDSTVIASMLILKYSGQLYYKFGCSLKKYLDLRPNNLLFYRLFKHASEHGFNRVGLGLSGVSKDYKGLVRFKEYMGGVPQNIYRLRTQPADYDEAPEKQFGEFSTSLTKTIIEQNPDKKTTDAFSEILYPYFA